MVSRVEWIGVASPQSDDRVVYRKLMRLYTQEQLDAMDIMSKAIEPLMRAEWSTARLLTPAMGFSREYQFGPRPDTYVREMLDEDVRYMFEVWPDQHEFKNLDDASHADRVPIVPWSYMNKIIYDILKDAAAGPLIRLSEVGTFASAKELVSTYERRVDVEKADHERKKRRLRS